MELILVETSAFNQPIASIFQDDSATTHSDQIPWSRWAESNRRPAHYECGAKSYSKGNKNFCHLFVTYFH